MTKNSLSIRQRFLAMASILLLILSAATYWTANLYGNRAARLSYDRLMLGSALQMAENINMLNGQVVIDLPRSAFSSLSMAANDRAFYAIIGPDKQLLTGYGDLPSNSANVDFLQDDSEILQPIFYDEFYSGELVRFVTLKRQLIEDDLSTEVQILVGQTMLARHALSDEIGSLALQFIIVFFLMTLALIMLGIWLVLRPLQTLKTSIEKRSPAELSPLRTSVPKEIAPLVDTVNYFMAQLDLTLNRLKRFTTDAAHQFRTPLAGLRAQAQNALDEEDEKLRRQQLENILQGADILSDIVDQLLNRAILTQRFQSEIFKPIALDELTKETCRELAVWALDKGVEIAYLGEISVEIEGDGFALQQMIRSILENAVKYSGDGCLVEVDIQLVAGLDSQPSRQGVILQIKDQGVGIPDDEKPQVFEAFYRTPDNLFPGTGIGLSIAKEVAEHHHAQLLLKDNIPNGLIVEVVFSQAKGLTL